MAEKGQITQFVLLKDGQLNAFNKNFNTFTNIKNEYKVFYPILRNI